MGSGWIVVADRPVRRVLGQDPRLNSGDLEMGRTHMWARGREGRTKILTLIQGLVSYNQTEKPRRRVGSKAVGKSCST